jgi:hypothetical protein
MSSRAQSPRTPVRSLTAAPGPAPDPALDEALERISDLAARLWAVRSAHRPVTSAWRRSHPRCAECGQAVPCATLQAAG